MIIGTDRDLFAVVPENINENTLTYRYVNEAPLSAPIEKGQRAATLQVWLGAVCIAQADLFAMNKVLPVGTAFDSNNERADELGGLKVLLYLFGIIGFFVVAGFLMVYLLRVSYITKAKRRSRRNSRNRRRSR